MKNKTGFTKEENKCNDHIIKAFDIYNKLEKQHPCEPNDFADLIHGLQGMLAIRIVRRDYPEGWFNEAVIK